MSDAPSAPIKKTRGRPTKSINIDDSPLVIGPTRKINPKKIPECNLEICQLDVGQGDAALIIFYSKNPKNSEYIQKVILIDGGEKNNSEYIGKILDQKFALQSDKKIIDAVIVTHNHDDHFGGIMGLNEYYKSSTIFFGRNTETKNKIRKNVVVPKPGESIWEYLDPIFYNENKNRFFNFLENSKIKNSIPNLIFCAINKKNIYDELDKKTSVNKTDDENLSSIACLISLEEFNFYTSGDMG